MSTDTSTIMGRYVPRGVIGRGGTSVVRRATDTHDGHDVAIKSIPHDPDLVTRAEIEVRAARRLDHHHIVRLLDWGRDRDQVHLVWELIDGPNIRDAVPAQGAADGWALLRIAEVMDALDHAHGQGVVHRDVKPANVLLAPDGRAMLSDFGVARLADHGSVTVAGDVVGTAAYMAPEQARGERATPATDVYAATLVLYELLTGTRPFHAREAMVAMRRAALGERDALDQVRPDLPARLVRVIERGLALDPSNRPAARDMADDLREFGRIMDARAAGMTGAARRLSGHLPAAMVGVGAALVCLAVGSLEVWQALLAGAGLGLLAVPAPGPATAALAVGATFLLGRASPGAAMAFALLVALIVAAGWRWPKLLLAPLAGPIAAAIGLLPLAMAGGMLFSSWPKRLWYAGSTLALAFSWQVWAGGSGRLLGPSPLRPASAALDGESNLFSALDVAATAARPTWVLVQGATLLVAALVAPLLLRAPIGAARIAAVGAWSTAIVVVCAVNGPDPTRVVAAVVPAAIILLVWAMRPWWTRAELGGPAGSATLPRPL